MPVMITKKDVCKESLVQKYLFVVSKRTVPHCVARIKEGVETNDAAGTKTNANTRALANRAIMTDVLFDPIAIQLNQLNGGKIIKTG
jgi:hypothetical protein